MMQHVSDMLFTQAVLPDLRNASSSNTVNMTVTLLLPNHAKSVSDTGHVSFSFQLHSGLSMVLRMLISSIHQQALEYFRQKSVVQLLYCIDKLGHICKHNPLS